MFRLTIYKHVWIKIFQQALISMFIFSFVIGAAEALPRGHMKADDSAGTAMNFYGTIYDPPPCKINGDQDMDVDFKNISIRRIGSSAYTIIKNITIDCINGGTNQLQFQIKGETMGGENSNILKTSITGFGIALQNDSDGSNIPLNKFFNVEKSRTFVLKATPIRSLPTIVADDFSAVATILTRYL